MTQGEERGNTIPSGAPLPDKVNSMSAVQEATHNAVSEVRNDTESPEWFPGGLPGAREDRGYGIAHTPYGLGCTSQ
jgi:hypothetical protein